MTTFTTQDRIAAEEVESIIEMLERAQYLGATQAANLIRELVQTNSAQRQRIMDLEDVIKEADVVTRWVYRNGEMVQIK